jgi:hypothetical protein
MGNGIFAPVINPKQNKKVLPYPHMDVQAKPFYAFPSFHFAINNFTYL